MRVLRPSWVGTRTERHDETVRFFRDVLGLRVRHVEEDFTVLAVRDGSSVEVFGPTSTYNRHFTSPVVGFQVEDLVEAGAELTQAGVDVVLPLQRGETGRPWLHVRAPDGFLYELCQDW